MRKGMLTEQEYDALMELFEGARQIPQAEKPSVQTKSEKVQPNALKSRCEALASAWSEALTAVTGQTADIRLRMIVKKRMVDIGEDETVYRSGDHTYIVCSEPLVNYINEQRLGAYDQIPQLMHPLTQIDKLLFERTGALLCNDESLTLVEKLHGQRGWLEARFDFKVAPFLRTTLRWASDESF